MKIQTLHIQNFRGHKKLNFELHDYHSLVGENGTGKTAILEAINLACSPYYLQSRINEQDFHYEDEGNISITVTFDKYFVIKVPDGFVSQSLPCRSVQVTIKRRIQASPGRALSEPFVAEASCIPVEFVNPNDLVAELLPEGLSLTDLPKSVKIVEEGEQSGILITRKNDNEKKVRSNLLTLNNNELVGFPNVFYFDGQRQKESKVGFNSLFSKLTKELNWRFRKSLDASTVTPIWEDYYSTVVKGVDKRLNKELVGPVFKRMFKVIGSKVDNLEISILNLEEPFTKSFMSTRNGLNQIDLGGLGSGVSMLFTYFLLEHLSQLAKGTVIFLIDEPELHLHPQLQQYPARHLKQTESQTIISTHSPLFIDLGKWRSISRFDYAFSVTPRREKLDVKLGPQTIREHLDDIPKWKQHETVFMDSDPEMLFARRVLLVEGPAEKYGLPRLARVLNQSFVDTTIISSNGKNKIIHYATICHAFEIPTFVFYDLDGKSCNDEENKKVSEAIGGLKNYVLPTSFESLLGIGKNAEHKASKVLEKIDSIDCAEKVPEEIKDAINQIANWSKEEKVI